MKHVKMMMLRQCPYCIQALKYIEQLKKANLYYRNVEIEMIDESEYPEIAHSYDYYYVPTFYVNDIKIHEGVPSLEKIQLVLEEAIK